ncbi:MAG: 2-C-methyl-D-erythritol 4-phosphate cytidylyltransferase [Firmicutes bacterium]|nr:2-C-methyl-D-erythritol 4-phosphate cytidylyltransferase [Bacillota bacterium]
MKTTVIIPAAGASTRMGGIDKVTLLLNNKPIFEYILDAFVHHEKIHEIIIATTSKIRSILEVSEEVKRIKKFFPLKIILGGNTRQATVYAALQAATNDIILVHDMARPLVTTKIIDDILEQVLMGKCAVSGVPSKDTIKIVDNDNKIISTPARENLWLVHTPQGFSAEILRKAHKQAIIDNFLGTDDATLVERLGEPVYMILGDYSNIKVTTEEDIAVAERFLGNL